MRIDKQLARLLIMQFITKKKQKKNKKALLQFINEN